MDTRTPGRNGLAVLSIVVVLGLVGCDSVYTIHSIAEASDQPSAVPDMSGLWAPDDIDSTSMVLRIAAEDYDTGHCRNADIRLLGATNDEEVTFGDQICFIPVAGHMVAQVRTTGDVQLYQQYLFRFDQQSMSFCDAIWADLLDWSEEHPQASAAHGLEFVRRGWEDGTQLFVTSSSDALRAYLGARLPKLARACDEDNDEGPRWDKYQRLTPPRQPDPEGAVDELPSPPG
jgi:hypothetical protein